MAETRTSLNRLIGQRIPTWTGLDRSGEMERFIYQYDVTDTHVRTHIGNDEMRFEKDRIFQIKILIMLDRWWDALIPQDMESIMSFVSDVCDIVDIEYSKLNAQTYAAIVRWLRENPA